MSNKMERFTQRARKILSLAQEEAEAAKSSEIDTHHILLGMLREEGCIARHVLVSFDIEYKHAKKVVDAQADPTIDKQLLDLSAEVKKTLEWAVHEARLLGHHYIGSEHLLLGLLRQKDTKALTVLDELDINPQDVRKATIKMLESHSDAEQSNVNRQQNLEMTLLDSLVEMLVSLWNTILRLLGISKRKR